MKFSSRTNWDLAENNYIVALRKEVAAARELIDLTGSNPTAAGLLDDANSVLGQLSSPAALQYAPEPFGMRAAREAVTRYYAEHGAAVAPERICLTTSTSEAYSYLFHLLCDPGDEVLVANPSYPLFEFIGQLAGVQLRPYPLVYADDWHIDFRALQRAITVRTKALIVVHPNNPTGNYSSVDERRELQELCAARGIALLVDEVFLDYPVGGEAEPTFASGSSQALTFVLSGISKVCGLPQMKISWIAAIGPHDVVTSAMARLEFIADTYLSVAGPTQHALPMWLSTRSQLQHAIKQRVRVNLAALDARLSDSQASRLHLQAGWAVVLRVPRHVDDLKFPYAALGRGLVVQPGEFYGLSEGHVVLSLLTPADTWDHGIAVLAELAGN